MWALDRLVYISKAHLQESHILSAIISWPWDGQSLQDQGTKYQNIKKTENKKILSVIKYYHTLNQSSPFMCKVLPRPRPCWTVHLKY